MKFPSKGTYMTRGVNQMYVDGELTPLQLRTMLQKHFNNEGTECPMDKKLNESAIKNLDGRVFSIFKVNGDKFFVITEGFHLINDPEHGELYPNTTIMLAEEY